MMISLSDKTKNVALNQQALWESNSLFQLNKITFPDLSLTADGSYMLTTEQLFVALRNQCDCHPIPPPFLIKSNDCTVVLCSYEAFLYTRLAEISSFIFSRQAKILL